MQRWLVKFLIVMFVLLVLAVGAVSLASHRIASQGPLAEAVRVVIPPGTSVRGMGQILAAQNVIASPKEFEIAARVSGFGPTLKAGEYMFEPHVSVRQVIQKLAFGKTASRNVTVPEGFTVRQVLAVLEADQGLKGQARPIPEEGHLFPDTYQFTLGTTRATLLGQMQERMTKELQDAWDNRSQPLPLNSPEELLILASIVQKEAANEGEMPQIAGVFINRLKQGVRLQSDPTVIYGADLMGNDIRKKDLTEDQPFNTYMHAGLPPTAIANPGRAALQATAHPAVTNAIFFMAMPDRSGHVFSVNYADHQKAVKAYWEAYNRAKKDAK